MSSAASAQFRSWAERGGFWNLLTWVGRSADQLAGLLLHPLVLVVFARSLTSDTTRISWFVSLFGLCWMAGYTITPALQRLTGRVIPWVVGGYVVRTAAIVLLAYAVSERTAGVDERYRSALICYGAYAAATGVARSSQSRHVLHGVAYGLWDLTTVRSTIASQALIGVGAWSLWSVLSEGELPWSQAFGRIWYLAAVALGLAALAAMQSSADAPEVPRTEPRTSPGAIAPDQRLLAMSALIATGAGAILFVEGLAFLTVFEDFRRQSILIRGSVALFAAGWIAASVVLALVRGRLAATVLAQVSIGFSMAGIVLAVALNDLQGNRWFPETIAGTDTIQVSIYAMAAVIGFGVAGRRSTLNPIFSRLDAGTPARIVLSLPSAAGPIALAYASRDLELQTTLGIGLGVALLVAIALGTLDRSGAMRATLTRATAGAPRHLAAR